MKTLRERESNASRSKRFKPGSTAGDIASVEELTEYLQDVKVSVPDDWKQVQNAHLTNGKVLYVDRGFINDILVHVALFKPDGSVLLNVVIDHQMSLEDLLKLLDKNQNAFASVIGRPVFEKYYGKRQADYEKLTLPQIPNRMDNMDIASYYLVEWSSNHCGYTHIWKKLNKFGLADEIMPPKSRSFTATNLFQYQILPGFFTHRLELLYPVLHPNCPLVPRHHLAGIDAIKLRNVMTKILNFY